MEVLKPEVYWIGNRCYRINPCPTSQNQHFSYSDDIATNATNQANQHQSSGETLKPYVEVDEFEDPPVEDESISADNIEIIKEDNGFKVFCNVPSSLFSHIIGSKGAVKKRIDTETKTRIYVPRQNEKGDILVRGKSERDVTRGHQRIQQIARAARFKRDATHFACFQMSTATVIEKAKEFREKVLQDYSKSSRGLEKNIFQEPEKLHLTICILVLLDERERRIAADILSSMEPEIKECVKSNKLCVQLKGLEIMNDDPTQVDVLYAKCQPTNDSDEATIQNISDIIAKKFAEKELGKESRGTKVKLHCTLINTRYRSGDNTQENRKRDDQDYKKRNNGYASRESFDARAILQKYGEFDFGSVEISQVKIATRHTTGNDGFYKCYAAITIAQ